MMKRLLALFVGLVLAVAAHAQTTPPPQAAAVGYNILTFGPNFKLGKTPDPVTGYPSFTNGVNIVPFTFFGTSWTELGIVQNSDGSISLDGTGELFGNGGTLGAVGQARNAPTQFTGTAFGGGFYAQAVFKGTGPMSWWANDLETMNGASMGWGTTPWPGQQQNYVLQSGNTATPGDGISIFAYAPWMNNGAVLQLPVFNVSGNTIPALMTQTAAAINANATLAAAGVTAQGSGSTLLINTTTNSHTPAVRINIQTVSGAFTEAWNYTNYADDIETDAAEFDNTNDHAWALHNWHGTANDDVAAVWGGPLSSCPGGGPTCTWVGPTLNGVVVDYTQYHTYGFLWVPATSTTQGYTQYYFDNTAVSNKLFYNLYNPNAAPPPVANAATNCVPSIYISDHNSVVCTVPASSAWSVMDTRHLMFIFGGATGSTVTFQSMSVWQATNQGNLVNGVTPVNTTKTAPPTPLTGSVPTQTWVSYDKSFSGVTLACGKPFHFNVLPPAQYNPTAYIYPLYIWLHPDFEGDPWYFGSNTNPLYITGDEAGSYNTVPFLTNYPAFFVAPYADQTNGSGATNSCNGDGNDAVQNWGGWFNNGSIGSGTHYSGDTGPNTFALVQMILFLENTYSIDPNRIYCNGFSLGGIGCEYLMQHYNAYNGDKGRYFAAGASEAGVDQADTPVTTATANLMRSVPTWYFSGANDGESPPGSYNTPLCSALGGNPSALTAITSASANQCGTSAMRYTLCPSCGHQDTDANGNPVWPNTTINTFLFGQSASGGVTPPPAETIAVSTISTQISATPFTVSGTIGGLTTAPTLQYSVNGGTPLALPTSSGTRNAYNQPGSNASVWNTPIGTGAIWTNAYHGAICYVAPTSSGPCTGIINPVNNFGVTEYTSTLSTDPTFSFSGPNGRTVSPDNGATLSATMHVPSGAFNPGPYPGDNPFILQDQTSFPNRQYTWSGITPAVQPPGLQVGQGPFVANEGAEWDDITSDTYGQDYDTGLSGFNLGDGVINACDVTPACNPFYPQIKHGLRYMLPVTNFASNATTPGGNVLNPNGWPDRLQDAQTGANVYTGSLPFGFTLGIPATTAMPAGLDANCQGLFWTMQHYPLIPRDAAAGGMHISMDQTAVTSAYGVSAAACMPTLVNLLQVMTNQHQGNQSFATNPANGPGNRTDTGPLALGGGGTTSVTATSFFFTEPGMAAGAANTISVRDANNTGTFGTSNSFVVTSSGGGGGSMGATLSPGFVSTSGNQFRDGTGTNERLACTGYPTPTANVANDMTLIRAQGFNCLQVPWYDKVTCSGGTCSFTNFDTIVSGANSVGLRVVFIHQANEGTDGSASCKSQQGNGLWYDLNGTAPFTATNNTDGCGTAGTVNYPTFKANWLQFANHYSGNSTVIGFDLHNEPTTFGNPACCGTGGGGGSGSGAFQVVNGQIIDPNGVTWFGTGPNIYWDNQASNGIQFLCSDATCSNFKSLFPKANFVRVVWEYGYCQNNCVFGSLSAQMEPYISRLTSQGIVVMICDFNASPGSLPITGATETAAVNWYSGLASTYKNNPYVWLEAQNEAYGPGATMSQNHVNLYNAVRAQSSTMITVFGWPGGGNPGSIGVNGSFAGSGFSSGPLTQSAYTTMHNAIWDLHQYPFAMCHSGVGTYPTCPNTTDWVQSVVAGEVARAYGVKASLSFTSADGQMPVVVGEFGNSTTGAGIDSPGNTFAFATGSYSASPYFGGAPISGWSVFSVAPQTVGACADGVSNCLTTTGNALINPYGTTMSSQMTQYAKGGLAGGTGTGVTVGAGWGTGTGADLKAMTEDVGGAVQAADPGVLILVEGILNNGTLFNGTARGSANLPITAGSISDLSTIGSLPVACCTGHVGYVVHDTPTDLSGVVPDSGNGATTMRNTAWGYLVTQNKAPVWIGKLGASLDNGNGNLADETNWAVSLTQYMNGQLGAQGGPVFSGCTLPIGGDWFNFGNLAGKQPDGTLNADNSNKSGQQAYWSSLLYTTCSGGGGGGGVGGTTWNPGDASAAMVLSNGNLTATDTATENSDSVRSNTSQSAGKLYYEITATTSSKNWAAGLANSTFPLTLHAGLGGEGNGIGFYNVSPTQAIYYNAAALSIGSSAGTTGDVIYFAVDLTNQLFWVSSPTMRAASMPWNNSGSADPGTGVGGLPFTGLTCPCYIIFNDEDAGGAATINAGGTFAGTVPTGFTAWQPTVTSGGRIILLNFAN